VAIVIADTSPIRYLAQIGLLELLPRLFESIAIPEEVALELRNASAPLVVREWMGEPPEWLRVLAAGSNEDQRLDVLDTGERAAIVLGISLSARLILIDDRKGARVATSLGFETTGTLGVLDLAARRGLVDLREAIDRLRLTNFRYRKEIVAGLLVDYEGREL
jgi:predicted nucleic acid-binding protein